MAIITTDDKHYSDIAKAIRSVSGSVDTLKPADMATMISDLKTAKAVEITMTQSIVNGAEAIEFLDSVKNDNALVSVLVCTGTEAVFNQGMIIGCALINAEYYYFAFRNRETFIGLIEPAVQYDFIINIGDSYSLYEVTV